MPLSVVNQIPSNNASHQGRHFLHGLLFLISPKRLYRKLKSLRPSFGPLYLKSASSSECTSSNLYPYLFACGCVRKLFVPTETISFLRTIIETCFFGLGIDKETGNAVSMSLRIFVSFIQSDSNNVTKSSDETESLSSFTPNPVILSTSPMVEMCIVCHFSSTTSQNTTMFGLSVKFDCLSGRWFGERVAETVREAEQ